MAGKHREYFTNQYLLSPIPGPKAQMLISDQWTWGFCFVKGVPIDPQSTKALIERIAFIRHTHYGLSESIPGHIVEKDADESHRRVLGLHCGSHL